MSKHQQVEPVLRREAEAATNPGSNVRAHLTVTAILFSVVGLLAGLGMSVWVMPPSRVTVVRQAPRISSWCLKTEELRYASPRLIWSNSTSVTTQRSELATGPGEEGKARPLTTKRTTVHVISRRPKTAERASEPGWASQPNGRSEARD